jgi:hypothetical protein
MSSEGRVKKGGVYSSAIWIDREWGAQHARQMGFPAFLIKWKWNMTRGRTKNEDERERESKTVRVCSVRDL